MRIIALILLAATVCSPIFAQKLSITPPAVTVVEGDSEEFSVVLSSEPNGDVTVTIMRQDGTEVRLNRTELIFTSENWNVPQMVRLVAAEDEDLVDNNGSLILIASGGGLAGGGITLSPEPAIIDLPGETAQLTATIHDQDGETVSGIALEWSSADPSVATVDSDGKVTAVGFGKTTITAALAAASGTATIWVDDPGNTRISERQILEILFKTTGGEKWENQNGWLTDEPLSRWHGIKTDAEGYVTDLNLPYNNLTGIIPPSLGRLSRLEKLLLHDNSLTGPIPPELGNLGQLKSLGFRSNDLTGSIPSELGNLTRLESLSLSANHLTGVIPPEFSNLVQLELLGLYQNELSGQIPPELGDLVRLENLWLHENKLTGTVPPQFGNLRWLKNLDISFNFLTGSIPTELGKMYSLRGLNLQNNQFAGSIPVELGHLPQLSGLNLRDNTDMTGLLPRGFLIRFNLGYKIDIRGTGICIQQDTVFLDWWNNPPAGYAEECTPQQVERLALIELYNKTGGTSWRKTTGWNSGESLNNWYGVTIENGRVTELSLPDNGLMGLIPGEISNFTELTVLNLAGNSLTGTLPEEISFLSELTELRINGNTNLKGILGDEMANNLDRLEVLHFGGTSLCAPRHSAFQEWYMGIDSVIGAICDNPTEVQLSIPITYLTQSIQTPERSVRLIEGRDALLRVFVTGYPAPAFFEYEVVATIRARDRVHQVRMKRAESQLLTVADENDLNNSFNAFIPGDMITSDATLVVEVDPDGVIPRAAGSQDRFPAVGEEQLNVVSVPAMDVTVVPVLEANQPDRSIFEWTDNISDNSSEVGLFKYAFPFHEFHARSRESYTTSLDLVSDGGRWGLVLELEALRLLDSATGYYYGAAASVNGYIRGRSQFGGWTSMGKASDEELAHEVGHNFNLRHAPCGGAQFLDPDYPHADGGVGAWGFDFRDSTLIFPDYHRDVMGYCYERAWISDYFFEKVIDFREQVKGKNGRPMAGAPVADDVLVLWGGEQGGELRMEPPFPASASVQLPDADGPYRLEGLGQQDEVMFSFSFSLGEDKFGDKYFFFAIPIEQRWEESLARIVLTSPEQSVTIDTNDQRRLSILRDASTGQVRGILRDWDGALPTALGVVDEFTITEIQGIKESIRIP